LTAVRHGLILLAEASAAAGLLGLAIVLPPVTQPAHVEVVVLLSGDGGRLPSALRLMERGVAPTLLFVGQPDTPAVGDVCRRPQPFETICVRPTPDDTRTEARAASRIARARHWQSIVVITSRYHLLRARLLFKRCFGGTVDLMGDYPTYGPAFARHQIAHEWLALVYASFLARGC